MKKKGHPWLLAKSFDTACPVGEFIDASRIADPHNVEIYCKVNDVIRQKSLTNNMIFDIPTQLEYITQFITLEAGDLLLTGTPAGVGPCKSGDRLEIGITNLTTSTFIVE